MDYKGYIAKIELDDDAGVFHGEIINTRDVITFQGCTVDELRDAMRESVETYLTFCADRNEPPEKPYSGKFQVRLTPDEHRELTIRARRAGLSLNEYIRRQLSISA